MTEKTQPSGTIPEHYRKCCGIVEPRELLKHMPFQLGNACKYLLRAPYKENEIKDLLKALDYLTWANNKKESLNRDGYEAVKLLHPFFKNRYIDALFLGVTFAGWPHYDDAIRLVKSRLKELGHDVE